MQGVAAACAMLVIIFDTRTAVLSAQEGIALCIRTIIPSLFPFFVLTGIINSCLLGQDIPLLQPLARLCRIPKGAESLLILGLFAGYPIGAQLISQAYHTGRLSKFTARRMLGFCNNAGPAFLFGILSPLFVSIKTVWVLWGVHILSSLITGLILPSEAVKPARISPGTEISLPESLQKAIRSTAGVCGWVVLFRVILGFCNRWFLWLFPTEAQVLISGLLELSNGCVMLQSISGEGKRFLLAGILIGFGGLCVGMQTMSVTEGLGTGWYFPGKVFQATVSVLLSILLQPIIFTKIDAVIVSTRVLIGLVIFLVVLTLLLRRKKVVAFSNRLLYNTGN